MSASLNDAALELTMPSLTGRSALSAEQQTELNRQKRHTRLANEKYFRAHPELRVMLGTFMAELLEARPEDVHGFAAQFFAERGLALLTELPEAEIASYQPFWALRAHLMQRLGLEAEARLAFDRAIGLADDPAVRAFLARRRDASVG